MKRYLVFVLGLYFLAAGVVMIVRSALGTTPISSVNYVMSLNTPLTLGTCTFIINMLLILGQFWLVRGRGNKQDVVEILLQIPLSLVLLLAGCLVQSVGVVLELKPRVAMMSAEAFVKYTSWRY